MIVKSYAAKFLTRQYMAAKIRVVPAQAPRVRGADPVYTATIGRTPENTVCLSFSPTVSRQHAIIRCHNGYEYQLMDLGSRKRHLRQRSARGHARHRSRARSRKSASPTTI